LNRFEIQSLLTDYQELHSEFQIKHFIIASQGDRWAQYKQCLREIKARSESIKTEEIQLKILEASRNHKKKSWLKKLGRNKIKVENLSSLEKLTAIKNTIKEKERELECFVNIAKKLKKEIGELTETKRYQLETRSWQAKGLKMAAIDIMASGRISNQTYDFLFALPKESMVDIIRQLSMKKPMELLGFE